MTVRPTTQHDIQRDDENTSRPGYAVVQKVLVTGTGLYLTSSGIDPGTGQVTVSISGSFPLGNAGGDLTGSYPNPSVFQAHLTPQDLTGTSVPTGTLILHAMDQQGFSFAHLKDVQGNMIEITRDNIFVVRNVSGAGMTKGQVVYITGSTGSVPEVMLAKADSLGTLGQIAVLYEDIGNNNYGRAMFSGHIEHINLSAFASGDVVYVSPSVAGGLTATQPSFPNYYQVVGMVLNNGVGNGVLQVYSRAAGSQGDGGWIRAPGTWTCRSIDSPIFNATVDVNITGTIGLGDRIWLQQNGASKLFLVHGVSISGSNSWLNLYGGTDYALSVTGSIINPYYSQIKAPFGFPVDPAKWTVTVTDTSSRSQASPTINVWYNLGNVSITVPIGKWETSIKVYAQVSVSTSTIESIYVTLSTANNSESDSTWTMGLLHSAQTALLGALASNLFIRKLLSTSIKTIYYLNTRSTVTVDTIFNRNDVSTLVIEAVSAYL